LSEIPAAAERVTSEFRDTDSKWKAGGPFNYAGWAKESSDLAKTIAYKGITQSTRPSAQYKMAALGAARRRAAWGGYRLAALLNALWP
jgi:hypothetical protein